MNDTPREQPPWPACADCQVTIPDAREQRGGSTTTGTGKSEPGATCDDIPLSQDFGPWTAELRRRAAEGMARALARVREETAGKDEHAVVDTKARRA